MQNSDGNVVRRTRTALHGSYSTKNIYYATLNTSCYYADLNVRFVSSINIPSYALIKKLWCGNIYRTENRKGGPLILFHLRIRACAQLLGAMCIYSVHDNVCHLQCKN